MAVKKLPKRILLCGFMGAGKSTIGRDLAKKLSCSFLDLDKKVEEIAQKPIAQIFEESGEKAFRKAERQALMEINRGFEGIVALGGGSLQNQQLLEQVKLNATLVFIETPISVILDRISQDMNRPLLLDGEGKPKKIEILEKELKSLYEKRLPLYKQADIKVTDNGNKTIAELSKQLLAKVREHVSDN